MPPPPAHGEIWDADLDPVRGHEQAGRRPVLIVSTDRFNRGPAGLVLAAPLTRTQRPIPSHIPIDPPEGGLSARSYVLCEALRSISTDRLALAPRGRVSPQTMAQVADVLRILLEL
jgi:mRNA interferase MazF